MLEDLIPICRKVFIGHFFVAPAMREDGVMWYLIIEEILEGEISCV